MNQCLSFLGPPWSARNEGQLNFRGFDVVRCQKKMRMNCIEPTLPVFPATGRPWRRARDRSAQRRQRLSRNTRIPCTFCADTQTHVTKNVNVSLLSLHRLSQGPTGPSGPAGPPGPRGSSGPKVSFLSRRRTLQENQNES